MSVNNLITFKENFKSVRANRFRVYGEIPKEFGSDAVDTKLADHTIFDFYVKSVQIPGSTIGIIPMNYRGREIKVPAERAYQEISLNVYESRDKAVDLRGHLVRWMNRLNSPNHLRMDPDALATWTIVYSGYTPTVQTKSIKLTNVFPIEISPLELNQDVPNLIADFIITLAFDYSEES